MLTQEDVFIGSEISRRRKALGWSQTELAHRVGYKDRSSIAWAETGRRHLSRKQLEEVAEVLGCEADELTGKVVKMDPFIETVARLWAVIPDDTRDVASQACLAILSACLKVRTDGDTEK